MTLMLAPESLHVMPGLGPTIHAFLRTGIGVVPGVNPEVL